MALSIQQQPRDDKLGKVLTIGGAVAGGLVAGPGGAAAGAAQGAGLGSTAGNLLSQAPIQPVEVEGMSRRREALSQDPSLAIQEAQAALNQLPPDQFPEVRRAYENALAISKQNQRIV